FLPAENTHQMVKQWLSGSTQVCQWRPQRKQRQRPGPQARQVGPAETGETRNKEQPRRPGKEPVEAQHTKCKQAYCHGQAYQAESHCIMCTSRFDEGIQPEEGDSVPRPEPRR